MKNRTKYFRSLDRIELIITYRCNRRCYNCDAMVRQAPSNEYMIEEQLVKFINETVEKNIKWKNIRVLGGEPTLHPEIEKFICILEEYKNQHSKDTIITIVSNGTGNNVNQVLHNLQQKYDIEVQNSNKSSDVQPGFWPVNQAPIDVAEYKNMDFSKGCWITSACGIALDMNGFYPCSAAAAIARVSGNDIGRKSLPAINDDMRDLFLEFCPLCGHHYNKINDIFEADIVNGSNVEKLEKSIEAYQKQMTTEADLYDEIVSETWKELLEKYKLKTPTMKKY